MHLDLLSIPQSGGKNVKTFIYLRGHLLVELTEHDNSAADIVAHSMYISVLLPS